MTRLETVFSACASITPDFAAQLAHRASAYTSEIYLDNGGSRFCVDSLIGILAMDLRRGARVSVTADGTDEQRAVEDICALLSQRASAEE